MISGSTPNDLLPLAQVSSAQVLPWLLGSLALAGWGCAAFLLSRRPPPAVVETPQADTKDPSSLIPIQVLVMDLSGVERELDTLQHNGLHSIASHLELNPKLLDSLRKKVRLLQANPHTLKTLGLATLPELQAWWDAQTQKPWSDIFKHQIFLLWSDLERIEQEITYETERHEELTCHMHCSMRRLQGKLDTRHALLSITDITLARGGKVSDTKEADILRDIFSQANMLVWRAKVRHENGRFLWRVRLPQHASSSPLYKMAGALEVGGLWDMSRMPDSARMDATSQAALLSGRNHYEQDFRALCSDGTHWIHEDVVIQKIGDDEWNLVAVATAQRKPTRSPNSKSSKSCKAPTACSGAPRSSPRLPPPSGRCSCRPPSSTGASSATIPTTTFPCSGKTRTFRNVPNWTPAARAPSTKAGPATNRNSA